MTQKAYVGAKYNNLEFARWVHSINVGVNGVARKVKKGYVGVNGVARQFWPYKNRAELSIPRGQKGIATVGNKVLIAGGSNDRGEDETYVGSTLYNTVDVFTLPNFTRSVTTLPYSLAYLTGTQNANYAYFVNGIYTNYDDYNSGRAKSSIEGVDAATLRSNGCGQIFAFNSSLSRTSLNSPTITFLNKGCRFGNRAIFGSGLRSPEHTSISDPFDGTINYYRYRGNSDFYSINNSNTIEEGFSTGTFGSYLLSGGAYKTALTSTDDYIFAAFGLYEAPSGFTYKETSIIGTSSVYRFNSSFTKTTTTISPNRYGASMANIGNNLVIAGGRAVISPATSDIKDVKYFNKNTMTVSTLSTSNNVINAEAKGLTFGDHAVFANGGSLYGYGSRYNAQIYDISLIRKDWPKYFGSLQYSGNSTAIVSNGYLIAVSNDLRNPAIDIWDTSFNYCN